MQGAGEESRLFVVGRELQQGRARHVEKRDFFFPNPWEAAAGRQRDFDK